MLDVQPRLLPTRARTAEQRRLELTNPRYLAKNPLTIRNVKMGDFKDTIEPAGIMDNDIKPIRFFPDGIEAVVQYNAPLKEGKEGRGTNYALLYISGKSERIDFYY